MPQRKGGMSRDPDQLEMKKGREKAKYKYPGIKGNAISFTILLQTNKNEGNSLPDRQYNNFFKFFKNRCSRKQEADRLDQGNQASQFLQSTYPVL